MTWPERIAGMETTVGAWLAKLLARRKPTFSRDLVDINYNSYTSPGRGLTKTFHLKTICYGIEVK